MSVNRLLAEFEERKRKEQIRLEFIEKFKPTPTIEKIQHLSDIHVYVGIEAKKLLRTLGR